jgi:transposase
VAKKHDEVELKTSPSEIEGLISRFERNELTAEDRALNIRLLRLVLTLVSLLQKKNATISKLKRMLFGPSSDRREPQAQSSPSGDAPAQQKASPPDQKPPGHGRLKASAYTGARRVQVTHPDLHAGSRCPHCDGSLFAMSEPAILLHREGQAPVTALCYERERLRCSSCQAVFTAPLPEGVREDRFDASADAAMAVMRYHAGVPFHRLAQLQALTGVPLPDSVQFDRCERLADAVDPVFRELERLAASAEVLFADDTRVRILSLRGEPGVTRTRGGKPRTGLYTTGMVAKAGEPQAGPRIALYRSGRKHAGENSSELLEKRREGVGPPIRVGDGASANRVGSVTCVEARCWAHVRRKFVEIEGAFPEQAGHVLDCIRELYRIEKTTRQMSPDERLAVHREQSAPMLEALKSWVEEQLEEHLIEPNSSLGEAVTYMLKGWEGLTAFTRTAGVPLDNNEAERVLKVAARQRKNSLFYRTVAGAGIGDVLQSVIQTCVLNGVNPIAYLTEVGRDPAGVRADPAAWVPWRWASRASPPSGEAAA